MDIDKLVMTISPIGGAVVIDALKNGDLRRMADGLWWTYQDGQFLLPVKFEPMTAIAAQKEPK